MKRRTGWPDALKNTEEPLGPWQTRHVGPLQVRYRRRDRYAKERRDFRRRWLVLMEHFGRESGIYRLLDWLTERLAR